MALPLERPATYEDLLAVPDHLIAEIIDGELYASGRSNAQARALTNLIGELGSRFRSGRGAGLEDWVILMRPELHFGEQVLVPSVAAWRRERMPVIPDVDFFELAPDWVCEVSSLTGALDGSKKLPVYARAGVRYCWLIDPTPRTLVVFRSDDEGWRLLHAHSGDAKVRAEPFDAIELELASLWAR